MWERWKDGWTQQVAMRAVKGGIIDAIDAANPGRMPRLGDGAGHGHGHGHDASVAPFAGFLVGIGKGLAVKGGVSRCAAKRPSTSPPARAASTHRSSR